MSKVKDSLSSVVFMWIGVGLAIIATLMMFVPGIQGGSIASSAAIFWGPVTAGVYSQAVNVGAWPAFVGYMLILLGGLILAVLALPFVQPSAKAEKITCIVSGICLLAGAVLVFLTTTIFVSLNGLDAKLYTQLAGPYIAGSLALLALGCDVAVIILDR